MAAQAQATIWPLDQVTNTLVVRGDAQTAAGVAGQCLVLDGESLIELKDRRKFGKWRVHRLVVVQSV
ncbi:MAG UNVERIFIED_CONTAM: hypothetical protein LVR18_28200 [Planctomycetaceae bacterium]|jgi:hypothetical protein